MQNQEDGRKQSGNGDKDEIYNPFVCAIVAANGTIINLFLFWCVFFSFFYIQFSTVFESESHELRLRRMALDMRFGVQPNAPRVKSTHATSALLFDSESASASHMEHWNRYRSIMRVCHEHYLTSDVNLRIIVVLISIYVVVVVIPSDWLTNNE